MVGGAAEGLVGWLQAQEGFEDVLVCEGGGKTMIEIKSRKHPGAELLAELEANPEVASVRVLDAVLPVLGRKNIEVPFLSAEEMTAYRERGLIR